MEINRNQSYNDEFYDLQNSRRKKIKGILIYEDAQKKLNISDNGKLYRQKFYNYLPISGPISAIAYGNTVLGKTKCLRYKDMILFKNVNIIINLFAFLGWPIILFLFMTLLTFLSVDYASPDRLVIGPKILLLKQMNLSIGNKGDFYNLWNEAFVNQLSSLSINSVSDFFNYLGVMFSGFAFIFIFPFFATTYYSIGSTFVNTNLIYILCLLLLTVINPVNIFNTIIINMRSLRFITVYEASSVYRYRK